MTAAIWWLPLYGSSRLAFLRLDLAFGVKIVSDFVGTAELAEIFDCTKFTAWTIAKNNPGFAVRFGGRWKVPRTHVERVLHGETPEQISKSAQRQLNDADIYLSE